MCADSFPYLLLYFARLGGLNSGVASIKVELIVVIDADSDTHFTCDLAVLVLYRVSLVCHTTIHGLAQRNLDRADVVSHPWLGHVD